MKIEIKATLGRTDTLLNLLYMGFLCGAVVKNLPANAGDARDTGSIPESGRSPGGGNGNPLQYSCLENTIDRGAWWAAVHGVTRTQILLSTAQSVQEIVKDREA